MVDKRWSGKSGKEKASSGVGKSSIESQKEIIKQSLKEDGSFVAESGHLLGQTSHQQVLNALDVYSEVLKDSYGKTAEDLFAIVSDSTGGVFATSTTQSVSDVFIMWNSYLEGLSRRKEDVFCATFRGDEHFNDTFNAAGSLMTNICTSLAAPVGASSEQIQELKSAIAPLTSSYLGFVARVAHSVLGGNDEE